MHALHPKTLLTHVQGLTAANYNCVSWMVIAAAPLHLRERLLCLKTSVAVWHMRPHDSQNTLLSTTFRCCTHIFAAAQATYSTPSSCRVTHVAANHPVNPQQLIVGRNSSLSHNLPPSKHSQHNHQQHLCGASPQLCQSKSHCCTVAVETYTLCEQRLKTHMQEVFETCS